MSLTGDAVTTTSIQDLGERIHAKLDEIERLGFTQDRKDALQALVYEGAPVVALRDNASVAPEGVAQLMWDAFMLQYNKAMGQLGRSVETARPGGFLGRRPGMVGGKTALLVAHAVDLSNLQLLPQEAADAAAADAAGAGVDDVTAMMVTPPNFIQRHRTKLIVGGIVAVLVTGGIVYFATKED